MWSQVRLSHSGPGPRGEAKSPWKFLSPQLNDLAHLKSGSIRHFSTSTRAQGKASSLPAISPSVSSPDDLPAPRTTHRSRAHGERVASILIKRACAAQSIFRISEKVFTTNYSFDAVFEMVDDDTMLYTESDRETGRAATRGDDPRSLGPWSRPPV